MKHTSIIISIALAMSIFFSCLLSNQKTNAEQPALRQNPESTFYGNYLGSSYKGNYVWGGSMNLAWNELSETILQEPLQLHTKDNIALEMVEKLNNSPVSKIDLDAESYYIKAGYGQETVDEINRESKKKFPSKSFDDLQMNVSRTDIISYAYFLKEVMYEVAFTKENVLFNGKKVSGFVAANAEQRDSVTVIEYVDDDTFIIKLQLQDKGDELILAKGYSMEDPQEIVRTINKKNTETLQSIGRNDFFEAPLLQVDHNRNYTELIGKNLANKGFRGYFIAQMFENIKFDMDEKGARVENEAVITAIRAMPLESRNFILDTAYWVIMKRTDSQNPYFILGVNNTELMEKR